MAAGVEKDGKRRIDKVVGHGTGSPRQLPLLNVTGEHRRTTGHA